MANSIETLLKSKQTVFNMTDLAFLWQIRNRDTLKSKIYYLIKKKKLIRIHQGIFVLDNNYNKFELAGKLKNPSYISLETILAKENIIFQYSSNISSVSNLSRHYNIDNIKYTYRKIKDSILLNQTGIIYKNNYAIADKERAFLDMLYLNSDYYFDNLENIDWNKCQEMVKIYQSKKLNNLIQKYAGQK